MMAKSDYTIMPISKQQCRDLLWQYHYLTKISKGFKSGYNYGLFNGVRLVGVIIFTQLPVAELAVSICGLKRDEQQGLFELSRLVLSPDIQISEHNITSWFVARAIKQFRKDTDVKLILSYADDDFHKGTIYRACNFQYYGLTLAKKDFWKKLPNGDYVKQSRGKTKEMEGEWRIRSRKHRFLMVFDKTLEIKWQPVNYSPPCNPIE